MILFFAFKNLKIKITRVSLRMFICQFVFMIRPNLIFKNEATKTTLKLFNITGTSECQHFTLNLRFLQGN